MSSHCGTNKPKKRPKLPQQWKRNVLKAKRARGESYTRPNGIVVAGRSTGLPCSCTKQCFSKLTEEEKDKLIEAFNNLTRKDLQDAYLHGLVSPHQVKRHRPRLGNRGTRSLSYSYKVNCCVQTCICAFICI